jgi:hypothetical protein
LSRMPSEFCQYESRSLWRDFRKIRSRITDVFLLKDG